MSLKPILDTYLDKLIVHSVALQIKQANGSVPEVEFHTKEVEQLRKNIHTLSGLDLDMSERALLNRAMKG